MKKVSILVISLIILAATGLALFFINQKRMKDQDLLMQEKMAELTQQQEIMLQAQLDIQKEVKEKEKLIQQAKEAQQMAESQAEKERLEREQLVAELNARLERESENRFKAEQAQQELAEKMQGLQAAQAETQAALIALEEASKEVETIDVVAKQESLALKERIDRQSQEMAALAEENKVLKERHEQLVESQMQTAGAIVGMGGTIERSTFVEVFLDSIDDFVKGAPHFWGYEDPSK